MYVDSTFLVFQNECIIAHTAFNQPAVDTGRVVMNLIISQLNRSTAGDRIGNDECV